MAQLALHHVNVIVSDLPRSLAFYQQLLGLTIIERSAFKNAGAWLTLAALLGMQLLHPLRRVAGRLHGGRVAECWRGWDSPCSAGNRPPRMQSPCNRSRG